jgi:hypothetical protein
LIRESFLSLPGSVSDALSFGNAERRALIEECLSDAVAEILTALSTGENVAATAAGKNGNGTSHPPSLSGTK